jgi:hypothetical protein
VNSNEAVHHDDAAGGDAATGSVLSAAPDVVEVRRNGGLAALVGAAASSVAIAYLGRATETGAAADWFLVALMGVLGALYLHSLVDARTPLLVADAQGVRIRLGRAWRGMPWGALAAVEHTPRRGVLRDGRLVLTPHNPDRVLAELDATGRRQSRISQALYGAPFALPLGLSTRVIGNDEDLTTALRQLAGSSARVVELVPGTGEPAADVEIVEPATPRTGARLPDPRPFVAHLISLVSGAFTRSTEEAEAKAARQSERAEARAEREAERDARREARQEARRAERAAAEEAEQTVPIVASATPAPLREPRTARRAEVRATAPIAPEPVEGRQLRRPGSVDLVEEKTTWGDRVRPIARTRPAVEPLVIDDFAVDPAPDPVIGPDLAAARTRIGLTVDQLAERTRIRPHVIESIEVDDFAPCGGDFYARGHLRTLSRVLGVEVAPLLAKYDERYADAPINPRRVFEAELSTGTAGGIRSTRGGPNWSMLIAAVMTVVLAWSIARLLMDQPAELQSPAPSIQPGPDGSNVPNYFGSQPVKVVLTGTGTGTQVTISDQDGEVYSDFVAAGHQVRKQLTRPATISAEDGGAVRWTLDGTDKGLLGSAGKPAEKKLRP